MNPTPEIREIFHFLFLQKLFEISDPFLYALKGGVNLRFFFNSPRYSEDMDIDVFGGVGGEIVLPSNINLISQN